MKIGDLLLLKGIINKKQLTTALSKQAKEAIDYNRSVHLGKVLIEMGHVTLDEISEVLNEQSKELRKEVKKKEKVVAHKIGEDTSLQMNLKTIGIVVALLLSGFAGWFSVTSAVEDNTQEIDNIKSMGDLKIISYKLDEYDETFKELKTLAIALSPLAADLTYIKEELNKLKNKEISMPEIDLSGIEDCKDKLDALSAKINELQTMSLSNEDRLNKLEKRNSGGSRF